MKMALYYLQGKTQPWAEEASLQLEKKISAFFPFENIAIKSKSKDRDQADEKRRQEATAFLAKISKSDLVILFDEKGKEFKSSIEFSNELITQLSKQTSRIIFVIGGPYGFDPSVCERAAARWSLGKLTMNHHVAKVVALEQIYRALTIWRNIPYHNA